MQTPRATLKRRVALDNRILAVLSQDPKDRVWSEREIATGLGQDTLSICALERLQAAGKVKLTNSRNGTYLCQLSDGTHHDTALLERLLLPYILQKGHTRYLRLRNVKIQGDKRGAPLIDLSDIIDAV